ncbi:hypothetical protein ACSBR1_001868 [Camellia fascicularis]
MELEVMIPSPAVDFNFDSSCTTPYISAPSSPQRIGNFFFSAPTSPTRSSSFFLDFNSLSADSSSSASLPLTIPFNWEQSPGIPKSKLPNNQDTDFEFDFSGHLQRTSLSADELFDGGKIKPLKPPPRLQFTDHDSPRSPRSPTKIFKEALSPRHKKRDFDPFAAAMEQTRRESNHNQQQQQKRNEEKQERGRERMLNSSASKSRRQKGTRSLSPFRVCDLFESESNQRQQQQQQQSSISSSSSTSTKTNSNSNSNSFSFSTSAWRGYKKWRLKDFLLFRSASEGRASSKDPLNKYSLINKSATEEVKNSSFRSTETGGASRRRGPAVSAHELHYTANRAVAEEMRKKTILPYKHGLLGCLGFNPTVNSISKGLGSLTRG